MANIGYCLKNVSDTAVTTGGFALTNPALFNVDDTGTGTIISLYVNTFLLVDGNLLVGTPGAGTNANKVLALSNTATAPSDSANLAQLYSVDISAGNATLAIFTETAVATDVSLVSTNSITIFWNGTKYKIPLIAV